MTSPADRAGASWRVAAGILASRIGGLLREGVFAHYFGASGVADAWRAALRLPNVLQNLLGEGTLSASFIPIYAELLEKGRDEEAASFAGAIFGLLTAIAGILAFLGIVLAPILVGVLFAGFDPARQLLTVELVRILFPMTALLVVSAWALGILNSHRKFFLPYVAPVAWNAAMIGAMILGGWVGGHPAERLVHWLAWGALVGGALQLGVQLPAVLRLVREFRPSLSLAVPGVREAIRNFAPVVAARGAVNLSGYLDYFLAAFLVTGSVAVLGYAQTLYLLPIALFGMSVAASELPELSRGRGSDPHRLPDELARGAERVGYFILPSTLGYLVVGDLILAALFQRGAFGADEVLAAWAVLAAYAVGMPASALSRLLSSAFYALRDTRTPARLAYLRIAVSFVVGVALIFPLDRVPLGALSLGPAGLAIGASVGAWCEFFLLRGRFRARAVHPGERAPHTARSWRVIVVSALVAAGVAGGLRVWASAWPVWVAMGLCVGGFALVYLGMTRALGVSVPLPRIGRRRDEGRGDADDRA